MREVAGPAPVSSLLHGGLGAVTVHEVALEEARSQAAAEDRQRRREAVLHSLSVARSRRRRRPVSRYA